MKIIISLLFSLIFSVSAFTQVIVENYSNGAKKAEGRLVNGQREGIWYEFSLKPANSTARQTPGELTAHPKRKAISLMISATVPGCFIILTENQAVPEGSTKVNWKVNGNIFTKMAQNGKKAHL